MSNDKRSSPAESFSESSSSSSSLSAASSTSSPSAPAPTSSSDTGNYTVIRYDKSSKLSAWAALQDSVKNSPADKAALSDCKSLFARAFLQGAVPSAVVSLAATRYGRIPTLWSLPFAAFFFVAGGYFNFSRKIPICVDRIMRLETGSVLKHQLSPVLLELSPEYAAMHQQHMEKLALANADPNADANGKAST